MGRFICGEGVRVELDDRVLAHIQVVTGTKLRRNEPFFFTWRDDISTGGGRTTVWVHSHATLVFKFHGGRMPKLNRAWLDDLMFAANSPTGLQIVPEPPEPSTSGEE